MEDWTYQEHYDLEDRHWWFRGRRAVLWSLIERSGAPRDGAADRSAPRILDAGCGTGRNLVEFGRLGPIEGVDLSSRAIEFCRRRGLDGVRRSGLEALPYEDGRFDLILATDVIEHIDDDGAALRELRRVASRDARLVLTVPAYSWLWSRHDEEFHHKRRYTRGLLHERVTASGWRPEVATYFYSTLLPPVAGVRAARRLRDRVRNGEAEAAAQAGSDFHVGEGFGALLERIVVGEARLIRRGVSLPAGVSVGMVCRAA